MHPAAIAVEEGGRKEEMGPVVFIVQLLLAVAAFARRGRRLVRLARA